jgi:hypothetical protein
MSDDHRLLYCNLLKNLCVFVHPYSWPCNSSRLLISGSQVRALHGSPSFQSLSGSQSAAALALRQSCD